MFGGYFSASEILNIILGIVTVVIIICTWVNTNKIQIKQLELEKKVNEITKKLNDKNSPE